MKTSLLRLGAVALLAAGSLNAQIHESIRQDVNTRPNVTIPEQLTADLFPEQPAVRPGASLKAGDLTQAIDWSQLWVTSTAFGPFWETYNDNPVFVYDAGTGMVGVVQIDLDGTFPNLSGIVNLVATMDNGANWSSTELFNRAGIILGFPAFATANKGTSEVSELYWTVFGWAYEEPEYNRTTSIGLFNTSGGTFDFPMIGPDFNNAQGYTWGLGDFIGHNGDAPSFHQAGLLTPPGDNIQYGAYGQWGFDPDFEDFTASSIPAQWDVNQFLNPNDLTRSANSFASLGTDVEGRVYMVVNNVFADDDQNRVPALSLSEDQGATWSTFERMPTNVLDAYRSQVGWSNIAIYGPFQKESLVITGVKEFSYFFRVRQANEAGNVINIDIVECQYNNGVWTLTRVAELNGFPLEFGRADEPSDAISEAAWLPSYALTSQGHEVGAAITADGSALVVKWIDENPNRGYIKFDQTLTAYFNGESGQPAEFDSLLTTDVYMAYRMMDGTWSTPVNHTDDIAYDKGTRIPGVVPSLDKVPVLSLGTFPLDQFNPQYSFYQALTQLPDLVFDANVDRRAPKVVQVGFFNAINPTSVNEDVVNYTFNLNAVAPNPAQNEAEVTFTMDVPGTVSLDLYSTTGSKVATVFNGHLSAGIHGLMVDASSIATGTYYVALTVNGQRLTQPLAIVK